jgi:RNA polymerase sigma-70 factor (ECF subfamily)
MSEERARQDRRLAERIGAGEMAALEEVYDAYSGAVYRQALAILGSVPDAEDALQGVFLKLVRRHGRPVRALKAYLLTAARHEACSILRRRTEHHETEELPDPYSVDMVAAAEGVAVRQALQALPAEQREVVLLKVFEQRSFAEIGQAVHASTNTVASRYRYALQKLRRALGGSADV